MDKRPKSHPSVEPGAAPLPADRAFVVQFRAPGATGGELFVGRAEHIASGDAARFRSVEDLIAFVTKVLESRRSS